MTATAAAHTTATATPDTTAETATAEPSSVPPRPVVSTSSFSDGTVTVAWEDPPPRAQVTKYSYRYKTGPGHLWSDPVTLPGTARSLTLTGLAPGAVHHVDIRAENAAGRSWRTTVSLGSLGASVPPAPGYWFSDDDGNVHEGAIEAIAAAHITLGCREDLYCPDEDVKRGQFASLLVRAFPDLVPDNAEDFFSDDDASVHEDATNRLASAGIAPPCAPGRFCPDDSLTRAQMATMLTRALSGLVPPIRDHFTDDDGSAHEIAINALASNGIVAGCGPGRFCPDDPVRRDQAAALLARALDLKPTEPRPSPWRLELVVDGIHRLDGTTDLQAPPGDDRLFLTLRRGTIGIIADGALTPDPFLDITHKVMQPTGTGPGGGEQGLLGLAFHPNFNANRKFYVFYTDLDGHSQVFEYRADPEDPNRADPSTARQIITFEQECIYHYGGQLQFGADGYLYLSVGDGGCEWPGSEQAPDPQTELGTIVRIDVDNGDPYAIPADNPFADGRRGLPEVWAYGLRNPWRFSFDGPNIYIADVGGGNWEEVNIADASQGGINYGWDTMEGTDCRSLTRIQVCDAAGLFIPQVDYPHTEGIAVIGGYVYRGPAIPEMVGRYFYSDIVSEWIRTFVYADGEVTEHYDWSRAVEMPFDFWTVYSFGKDGHGELYVLARTSVYKIVPR